MRNLKHESVQIEAGRIITGLRSNSYRQKLYCEFEGRGHYKIDEIVQTHIIV